MHMLQYTDSSALDDTFIVFGWHFHGKCIERQRRTSTLTLRSFDIHFDSKLDIYIRLFRGWSNMCSRARGDGAEVSWKERKKGRGMRGGWVWMTTERLRRLKEKGERRRDGWRWRSTQFRSSQARIHHGSIHLHGRIANADAEKTPSAPRRQMCSLYYVDPCTIHPRTCSASLLQSTPLPAGYAKNGALVSGIVHSATARRLLLLLLMHDHCKAWFSVPNSFLKDIANYTHTHNFIHHYENDIKNQSFYAEI